MTQSDGQQRFVRRLKDALGPRSQEQRRLSIFRSDDPGPQQRVRIIFGRDTAARLSLLDQLIDRGGQINLPVVPLPDTGAVAKAIVQLAVENAPEWSPEKSVIMWRHPLLDRLDLPTILESSNITVQHAGPMDSPFRDAAEARRRLRSLTAEAFIGVTSADYCISDSATLVLCARPGQPRSVSLLPGIHVAVISLEQIIASLNELYALLEHDITRGREGLGNCVTFITGASKTADIEAVLVPGVHGPRQVVIYVITERRYELSGV